MADERAIGTPKIQTNGAMWEKNGRRPFWGCREMANVISILQTWMHQGDRILLYMDANENVITGPLCSKLADIGLTPWGHRLHGHLPNTHVEGSECIDEVWGSIGLEVTGLKVLPFSESIGDNRTLIVDFTTRSAIGLFAHLVVRPDCRWLVNSNRQCADKYRSLMEEQFKIHRIQERLEQLTALNLNYPVEEKHSQALEYVSVFKSPRYRPIVKITAER
jgi:hypothetical protein